MLKRLPFWHFHFTKICFSLCREGSFTTHCVERKNNKQANKNLFKIRPSKILIVATA